MNHTDAAWLHMDQPTNLMVITGVLWFEEVPDWTRVRRLIEERFVGPYPRFRQRVVEGHPPLSGPHWEDDPNFNLDLHLVDGYGGGAAAMIQRIHHCIADGIALARVLLSLADDAPDNDVRPIEALTANIERFFEGKDLEGSYDGHANCFVETGFHKALLIDFNYEVEPLPGRYPTAHAGLPLLRESRLNHMAKLAFQPFYWHALLPGRDVPGIGAQMSMAGKQPAPSKQGASE
jgi:hypothetical protein